MANTYSSLYYRIIFSTKNRVKSMELEIEKRLWRYIGGIARKHGVTASGRHRRSYSRAGGRSAYAGTQSDGAVLER